MAKGRVPGMRPMDLWKVARKAGDPILDEPARAVTDWGPRMRELGMRCRMHVVRDPGALGVAAPQLGIPYRILAYRTPPPVPGKHGEVHVLVNPYVAETFGEMVVLPEGCFSVDAGEVLVPRWQHVRVMATDLAGGPVEVRAAGDVARILQHEIDHLDGVLITRYGPVQPR